MHPAFDYAGKHHVWWSAMETLWIYPDKILVE